MEVTLHGVMGGPEIGPRFLAALVRCRPQLKAALGQLGLIIAVPRQEAEAVPCDAEHLAVLDWVTRALAAPALSASARKLD